MVLCFYVSNNQIVDVSRNLINIANITASGTVTAPSFTGRLQGASTGAPDATIWCVSGQYTDWGIFYNEGDPDKIEFKSGGNVKASIALDNGNINTSGTVTASGGNSGQWNIAYGWGNHANANYIVGGGTWTGGTGSPYTTLAQSVFASGNTKFTFYGNGGKMDVITDGEFYANEGAQRVFHDSYHPNADKWTTARSHTVTLTGQVTGSATQSVDGTGNKTWSIATTLNDSALDDQYVTVGSRYTGNASNLLQNSKASIRIWDVSTSTDKPTGAADGLVYSAGWDSSSWGVQQYHDFHSNNYFIRNKYAGTWQGWDKVWTEGNFNPSNYSTTSVSDSRYVNITGDTMGGNLNLNSYDLLDVNDIRVDNAYKVSSTTVIDSSRNLVNIANVQYDGSVTHTNTRYEWRRSYVLNNTTPKELLDKNGNSLANGGVYRFSAHISGTGTDNWATAVYWNQNGAWKLNVTQQSGYSSNHPEFIISGGKPTLHIDHSSNYAVHVFAERLELSEGAGTDNNAGFGADAFMGSVAGTLRYNPNGGASSYNYGYQVFHDNYHPNADKWTTARTLSLTGDVTGSVSWDGSANASITTVVANDSHTHDGRYYTETESDSRFVNVTGDTMTGTLTVPNLTIGSGNKIKFANNDYIRYDDVANRFHFDSDGGTSNASVQASTFVGALSGNASTASKWATARTLTLSGDLSGSVSIDGSSNVTLSAQVSNDSHNHNHSDGDFSVGSNLTANRYFQRASGIPTNNLGSPTVTEMALFDSQFNNKTEFFPPSALRFYQTTDGTNWTEITTYSDDQKKRFLHGDANSSVVIPNQVQGFRIEVDAQSYVFLNALYMYWSSQSHNTTVHVYKQRNSDSAWLTTANSSTTVSSWPGHLYLPFNTITFNPTNSSQHGKVRIEFTPNWSTGTYSDRNINLYSMQLWGGYPAGRRNVYYTDQDHNVDFPSEVKGTSFNADSLFKVNGTTVIDSSRNAFFANTTHTGNMYWNGHIYWGASKNIYVQSGECSFDVSTSAQWRVWDATNSIDAIKVTGGSQVEIGQAGTRGLKVFGATNSTTGYQVNGTTVIDSSRNFSGVNLSLTGKATIWTNDDAPLVLRQGQSGHPWNYIEFRNSTNDRNWYAGTNSSGDFTVIGETGATGQFITNKAIRTSSGYMIDGTTVIDSSRNGSFNGLTVNGNGSELNFTGGNNRIKFSGYRAMEGATDGSNLAIGESYINTNIYTDCNLSSGHSYKINGTTVIDSGRNVYSNSLNATDKCFINGSHNSSRLQLRYEHGGNPADGNSGFLTMWVSEPGITYDNCGIGGNINSSGQYYGRESNGSAYGVYLRFDINGGASEFWSTTGSAGATGGKGTQQFSIAPDGYVSARSGYKVGSTTVIDSSRNLTNIGRISSNGNYTTSTRLKLTTNSGYIEIGPQNSGWCHVQTDRGAFYFNKKVTVDSGIIESYNQDLVLRRARSSSHQITLTTSGATFTGNVSAYSDRRLKDNIKTLDGSKVYEMRGVSFTKDGELGSGVIAQELEQVAPELVLTNSDEMKTKSVAYGNVVGYLIEAIKELKLEIEELKNGNNTN